LTKYLTHCKIIATDVSQDALKVAHRNIQLHRVEDSVSLFKGDLFLALSNGRKRLDFEVIVSNPPYIPSAKLKSLPLEVKCEPAVALDGGEDGLSYYRRIIAEAPQYLVKGGYLIMEIGFGQLKGISEIICAQSQFKLVDVIRDYSNIERIVVAQKKE
jgi:release factor glutamine methyltransferase